MWGKVIVAAVIISAVEADGQNIRLPKFADTMVDVNAQPAAERVEQAVALVGEEKSPTPTVKSADAAPEPQGKSMWELFQKAKAEAQQAPAPMGSPVSSPTPMAKMKDRSIKASSPSTNEQALTEMFLRLRSQEQEEYERAFTRRKCAAMLKSAEARDKQLIYLLAGTLDSLEKVTIQFNTFVQEMGYFFDHNGKLVKR
jgi:hypothetical protein